VRYVRCSSSNVSRVKRTGQGGGEEGGREGGEEGGVTGERRGASRACILLLSSWSWVVCVAGWL